MKFILFYTAMTTALYVRMVSLDLSARANGLKPPEVTLGFGPKIGTLNVVGRDYDLPLIPFPLVSVDPFRGPIPLPSEGMDFVEMLKRRPLEQPEAWVRALLVPNFVLLALALLCSFLRLRFLGTHLLEHPLQVEAVSDEVLVNSDLRTGDIILGAKGDSGDVMTIPRMSYLYEFFSLGFSQNLPVVIRVERSGKLIEILLPTAALLLLAKFRTRIERTRGLATLRAVCEELLRPVKQILSVLFPVLLLHEGVRKRLAPQAAIFTSWKEFALAMLTYSSMFLMVGTLLPIVHTGGLELWLSSYGTFRTVTYYDYVATTFGIVHLMPFVFVANIVTWVGVNVVRAKR